MTKMISKKELQTYIFYFLVMFNWGTNRIPCIAAFLDVTRDSHCGWFVVIVIHELLGFNSHHCELPYVLRMFSVCEVYLILMYLQMHTLSYTFTNTYIYIYCIYIYEYDQH